MLLKGMSMAFANVNVEVIIQFNDIYALPKQYNCLKALYRAQSLNPPTAITTVTGARKNSLLTGGDLGS